MNIMHKPADTESLAGATADLARFTVNLDLKDVDAFTVERAKTHLFDTVGACITGAVQQVTVACEAAMSELLPGGDVPVPGQKGRYDVLTAAFLGGTAGHGLELDDGFRPAGAHPGVAIVPTVLSAGYHYNVDGKTLLRALIAGYEVMGRIGAAMHPRQRQRGFHNTAVAGVFGAAAAVSVFRGHDEKTLKNAFGLASSMASGINTHRTGGDAKRMHPGLAARSGIMAATMAEKGFEGLETAIEDKYGFFTAFAGTDNGAPDWANIDILEEGGHIKSDYVIGDCYIKPHACCRHLHPMLDALIDIVQSENLSADQVEKVEVGLYEVAVVHGEIGWDNFTTSQMSIPFTAATALHKQSVQLAHFTPEARGDKAITADCAKVSVYLDKELDAQYPEKRPTRVDVTTKDGKRFSKLVDEPLGAARNPVPEDAMVVKYMGLAAPVIGEQRATDVLAQLRQVEQLNDIRGLVESMAL
jgi:2-methylcitrate dehydratase PrpD